jgi:hypothetical protein
MLFMPPAETRWLGQSPVAVSVIQQRTKKVAKLQQDTYTQHASAWIKQATVGNCEQTVR